MCVWNAKCQFFLNRVLWRLELTTGLSREFKLRANCLASLGLLSCSAIAGVTLQLLYMLHTCASFGDLSAASQSQGLAELHTLEPFFTLSHTLPLHDSHLNTRFLNVKLQANWHGIKPTKWLIKFNLKAAKLTKTKHNRWKLKN